MEDALRRADWRWLLPKPCIARALCLATGDMRKSIYALDLDQIGRVDDSISTETEGMYDLVLASDIDRVTLGRAQRALRSDGVLCAEVRAANLGGVQRLLKRLRAGGFSNTQLVMRWDVADLERAWIPIDAAKARRYFFLRHPIPARHPLKRLWFTACRRGALTLLAVGSCDRVVVIAHAAPTFGREADPSAPNLPPWWVQASVTGEPSSTGWLLLTPGPSPDAKAIGLVFTANAECPRYAVKLGRTRDVAARAEREHRALDKLHEAGVTARGLAPEPKPSVVDSNGRALATVQRAVCGRWLDTALRASTLPSFTSATTDWLIALAAATRQPPHTDVWERRLRPTIARFEACAHDVVDRSVFHEAVALIAQMRSCPSVFEHHDFAPWNIYLTQKGRLVAMDWDNSDHEGLPAFDLIQIHGYLAFSVDRALLTRRYASSHRSRESGSLGQVWRACRQRYADAVGIDTTTMRAVRAFAWMSLAADDIMALRAAGAELRRTDVERSLLGLWEAEARAALRDEA